MWCHTSLLDYSVVIVNDIWNKIIYELRKWNENEEMIVAVNAIYAIVKKPEKNSGLQQGLNLWPHDYQGDALPTELWRHWRWEQVNYGFICSRERNECCYWKVVDSTKQQ